jgi:hypothetical protein
MNASPQEPFKSKLMFCWLALLTGVIGGHWIYAGKKRFWFYMLRLQAGLTPCATA